MKKEMWLRGRSQMSDFKATSFNDCVEVGSLLFILPNNLYYLEF